MCMTGMLASVATLEEAELVLAAGADIIDLKAPAQGALGALTIEQVKAIVLRIDGQRPVSATIGDLPMESQTITEAVTMMATTGVDYVKIGFFPGGQWGATIEALGRSSARRVNLIAVLFADQNPDFTVIAQLANAGFRGVMLDTMNKACGSLRTVQTSQALNAFISEAKKQSLLCGLAGSLRHSDIASLLAYSPDYLGFRGALCHGTQRTGGLDVSAVQQVRAAIPMVVPELTPDFS